MQEIRNGNFEVCLTDSGKDEIGDIVHTINEMNASIRNTLEAKIQSEKEKNRLQYSLLISSMDPHFIYNTLDTITFLAAMNKTQDIITVNNALIGTLKDRIKMKSLRVSDTVRNEREVLRQYMIIEDYLYSEPITYTFEVSDEDLELRIPKNILQPLVENSIKHGLMPNKSADRKSVIHGEIRVSINRAAGKAGNSPLLLLQVSDNGIGMTNAAKEKYQSAAEFSRMDPDHIGLTNIYLRLQYLFSDNFTFQILDNPGGGTIIQIQIPYNL